MISIAIPWHVLNESLVSPCQIGGSPPKSQKIHDSSEGFSGYEETRGIRAYLKGELLGHPVKTHGNDDFHDRTP